MSSPASGKANKLSGDFSRALPHLQLDAEATTALGGCADALEALATFDERKGRVVELRFFGGLSVEETASVLKVSPETVMRDWRLAKAWLQREMREVRSHDA